MSDRQASCTALGTAYLQAPHQVLDAPLRIPDDPLPVLLLGLAAVQWIHAMAERYHTPERQGLRVHVVLRSRFAEDRLAAAGLAMPENADFATIDLKRESLREGLLRSHVALDKLTFFSWLGATIYLNEDAIEAVLRSVATFPACSEIVLTFSPLPGDSSSPFDQRAASLGEPWVSYFAPEALEAMLRGTGFATFHRISWWESFVLHYALEIVRSYLHVGSSTAKTR